MALSIASGLASDSPGGVTVSWESPRDQSWIMPPSTTSSVPTTNADSLEER